MSRALPPRKAEALHQALAQLLHGVQETAAEVLTHLYDTGGLAELEMELEAGPPSPQPKSKSNKFHDKAVQGWGSATCGTLWADLSNNTAANIDDDLYVIDAGRSSNTWLAFEAKMNQPLAKALAAHSHNKQRYSFPREARPFEGWGPQPHTRWYAMCTNECVYEGSPSFGYHDRCDQAKSDRCKICGTKLPIWANDLAEKACAHNHIYTRFWKASAQIALMGDYESKPLDICKPGRSPVDRGPEASLE